MDDIKICTFFDKKQENLRTPGAAADSQKLVCLQIACIIFRSNSLGSFSSQKCAKLPDGSGWRKKQKSNCSYLRESG